MSHLTAFVAGISEGNHGKAGIGAVITDASGAKVRFAKHIGLHPKNVAEYAALVDVLQYARQTRATALHVFSSSSRLLKNYSQSTGHL